MKNKWFAAALLLAMMTLLLAVPASAGIYTGDTSAFSDMLGSWFDDDSSSSQSGAAVQSVSDVEAIYTFTLDGVGYTFPCPMSDLLNNGWAFAGWAGDPGASLDAMTYSSALLKNANGQRITVEIMNPTQSAVTVANARLLSIEVRSNDTPPAFSTGAGLKLGDGIASVPTLYGEGYTEYGMSDGGKQYKYTFYRLLTSEGSSIGEPLTQESWEDQLTVISGSDGNVTSVTMMHARF